MFMNCLLTEYRHYLCLFFCFFGWFESENWVYFLFFFSWLNGVVISDDSWSHKEMSKSYHMIRNRVQSHGFRLDRIWALPPDWDSDWEYICICTVIIFFMTSHWNSNLKSLCGRRYWLNSSKVEHESSLNQKERVYLWSGGIKLMMTTLLSYL